MTDILPPPSEEQMAVIHAINDGFCVSVSAVAGSGKTTCMLQVVSSISPYRNSVIVTYNRALADECKLRIRRYNLQDRVSCYTIHGLISRVSCSICNDDTKLDNIVRKWEAGCAQTLFKPIPLELVLLDEAQDLRPSFHRALNYIFSEKTNLQMCLVGDTNQLLYDFPTYGCDKASAIYLEKPKEKWKDLTKREWKSLPLSVSYRLTPNIATFVNTFWGTNIVAGNNNSKNLPVEYFVKYLFPPKQGHDDKKKLDTKFLAKIIDDHGPENVLFLASSVKSDRCPIRVHANELMKVQKKGQQKYSFDIKEKARGFEGKADTKNKVRVWTFCGSKGVEADVVVVFGLDIFPGGTMSSLNQVGVALSRARKRLIVLHQMSFSQREGKFTPNMIYPLLGDSPDAKEYTIRCNSCSKKISLPMCVNQDKDAVEFRAKCSIEALSWLQENKVVTIEGIFPTKIRNENRPCVEEFHLASAFAYFSASAEMKFISCGNFSVESGIKERIEYDTEVQFSTTKEDVSALYGEALTYMMQWELNGFCPNVETVVNDGIIHFDDNYQYSQDAVILQIKKKKCEALSSHMMDIMTRSFHKKKMKGEDVIKFLNTRMRLQKKRQKDDKMIYFPVKAVCIKPDDDAQLKEFLPIIKTLYHAPHKEPWHWIYIANASMAFSNYYEKLYQIGTDPTSYIKWVNSKALLLGLFRLRTFMSTVSTSLLDSRDGSVFERELIANFEKSDYISSPHNGRSVIGIQGICDWVGTGLKDAKKNVLHLLEIKFVHELSNSHRLQVLVYCALLALEDNIDCRGVLYNARTEETEVCLIKCSDAMNFLLSLSQFKCVGNDRQKLLATSNKRPITLISDHTTPPIFISKGNHGDPVILD